MSPKMRRRRWCSCAGTLWHHTRTHMQSMGQALVEYVLIVVLLIFALIFILSITGPAVGNVFSNTLANLLDLTLEPEDPMSEGEFWNLVTAVASYTPESRALITNTPAGNGDSDGDGLSNDLDNCDFVSNPDQNNDDGDQYGNACDEDSSEYRQDRDSDGVFDNVDNCPLNSNPTQADSNGYRDGPTFLNPLTNRPDGDACEPPPAAPTNTPGPSPTPQDKTFGYPFQDNNDPNNWETDFSTDLKGPFNAQFWDYSQCNGGSIFDATGNTSVTPKAERQESEIVFPRASHDTWKTGNSSPAPGVAADFCSRFTLRASLTAGEAYKWRYRSDDGLRIYVNGTNVIDDWSSNADWHEVDWTVPDGGSYDIVIVHRDASGDAALEVYLKPADGLSDSGDCNWTSSGEKGRSGQAWSDSPGAKYNNSSFCILRLRGTLNLSGAQRPFIEWWDQHDLATTDIAWVALREAGTENWYVVQIHRGQSANLNWERQEVRLYDLDARLEANRNGGATERLDFRDKRVEVGFILEADASNNGEGWWIDDFRVFEKVFPTYNIGFADAVGADNATPLNAWIAEGSWGQTNAKSYSGNWSWTDSPSGNYGDNADSSLQLNGLLDLTAGGIIDPELAFWHSWTLAPNDSIFVDVSADEGASWSSLPGSAIATANSNADFKLATYSLGNFLDQKIMLRFRINTDGSTNADGWYVDDIQFRNAPITTPIRLAWCDDGSNGLNANNWIPEGKWALAGEAGRGGGVGFSDSPGIDYTHGSNNALTLGRPVDLTGTARPVLEFWHKWALGGGDSLNVDISLDEGANWQSSAWSFAYNSKPTGYSSSIQNDSWSTQNAWQRVVIPLTSYTSENDLMLRWRLDALSDGAVAAGWSVDDICLREMNDPILNVPWSDSFDGGLSNWYAGGAWTTSSDNARSGSAASDSPGDYAELTDNVLELKGALNLSNVTAAQQPTLYYWETYWIGNLDRTYAEVMVVDSSGLPTGSSTWEPVADHQSNIGNVALNRRQINLSAYAGQYIKLRFRLQALNTGADSEADGWYIDEVAVVLRAGTAAQGGESTIPLPYIETGDFGASDWVMEGSWSIVNESRPLGSGSILGPGQWQVQYRDAVYSSGTPQVTGTLWGQESVAEIDFQWGDCSTCAPAIVLANNDDSDKSNNWVAIYRRSVYFNDPVRVKIEATHDDGYRLYVDNIRIANEWGDGDCCQTTTRTYDFSAGAHEIRVEFVEKGYNAYLNMSFTKVSGNVAGFDPFAGEGWRTYYHAQCADGSIVYPALNETEPPIFTSNIDVNWPSGTAPQIVLDRNLSRAGIANVPGNGTNATPFQHYNNQFMFEAEGNGTGANVTIGSRSWQQRSTQAGASGSAYMEALPNSGANITGSNIANSPSMNYVLNFPQPGTYYVAVRGYAVNSDANTVYVGLNGAISANGISLTNNNGADVAMGNWSTSWSWLDKHGTGAAARITVPSAGNHTLNFWMREDGFMMDRIWVGLDQASSPLISACPHPNGTAANWWVARYVRSISVSDPTTFTVTINSDDGHRLYLDGAIAQTANKWTSGQQSSVNPITLTPGTHSLEVLLKANTGDNRIQVSYSLESPAFHTDADGPTHYPHQYAAGLIFEGEFILPAGSTPTLSWWDKYEIAAGDIMYVEISPNGGYDAPPGGSSEWVAVYTRGNHTNNNWTKRLVDLTSFASPTQDRRIVVRFRLDALQQDPTGDGWWIDDIQVAD